MLGKISGEISGEISKKFIALALNLSKKNIGNTGSNPVVGCVIVKDGQILSTGITEIGGRPHAEIVAINKIIDKSILCDAEIYITLEPCSHFGNTPPCVDEIIKYNFKKVVIATIDPDIRVNGGGVSKLKEAGIAVEIGVLEEQANKINIAFRTNRIKARPFITAKIATTIDGKIATANFASKWISNKDSLRFAHYLRSINNAIMIGKNTLLQDNPSLNTRLSGLEFHQNKIIIVSNSNNLPIKANVFQNIENNPVIIITNNREAIWQEFVDIGVKIIFAENIESANEEDSQQIDWQKTLKILAQEQINSILVEGGSYLLTTLIKQNFIDELFWIRSNKIIGDPAISSIGQLGLSDISQSMVNFIPVDNWQFENDLISKFVNVDIL